MTYEQLKIAAIIHAGDGEGDLLVKTFADELKQAGWNVQGLLTKQSRDPMVIYNISNNEEFIISQQLGKGSQSCTLHLGALATASSVLRKALENKADLVIVNRFGTAEAEGKGLIAEIQALISHDIAVLTLTNNKYLPQWREFTGGLAAELPLNKQFLHEWFNNVNN